MSQRNEDRLAHLASVGTIGADCKYLTSEENLTSLVAECGSPAASRGGLVTTIMVRNLAQIARRQVVKWQVWLFVALIAAILLLIFYILLVKFIP